jgi:hypothetical protein
MTVSITIAADEHELECELAVADAIIGEIDAELADENEPTAA